MSGAGSADGTLAALRRAGLGLAGVEESVACEGTALESVTCKVRGKSFLFLRPGKAMVKLGPSLAAAAKLAAKHPGTYRVGSGGWTTVDLSDGRAYSRALLEAWIAESHGLFAAAKAPKPAAKKPPSRKSAARKPATSATSKSPATKSATKKSPAKKSAAKKNAAKRAPRAKKKP